jgi:aromatic-L-amino-acid/L-tryptophan decarboxylase
MASTPAQGFQSPRREVLDELIEKVLDVWSGFDSARDVEPELDDTSKKLLQLSLPEEGSGALDSVKSALRLLDQSTAQSRPRFFAYIGSSGLEIGAIADFLASTYDINLAVDSRAASQLEQQTATWLGDFIGFSQAKGLFTSGGTVSNITALAIARTKADPSSRRTGVTQAMSVYCSTEAHYSNQRAVELLGLGSDSLRAIPTDQQRKMNCEELRAAIEADLKAGVIPMAIIASAGTTLTGAIDPLLEIAAIAKEYGIWLHVDGAYGAPAAGTKEARAKFAGLDLADSVTVDAHKWLFVPKACSILLTKDWEPVFNTFNHDEAYMPHDEDSLNPTDLTLEYSRPVRALKLWMGFYAHGAAQFRLAITGNLKLAKYAYRLGQKESGFRVLPHEPELSIVPMQYLPMDGTDISDHNRRLCEALVKDGRIFISPAVIDGEVWLRPCFTNFRTTESDVDELFKAIREVSAKISGR